MKVSKQKDNCFLISNSKTSLILTLIPTLNQITFQIIITNFPHKSYQSSVKHQSLLNIHKGFNELKTIENITKKFCSLIEQRAIQIKTLDKSIELVFLIFSSKIIINLKPIENKDFVNKLNFIPLLNYLCQKISLCEKGIKSLVDQINACQKENEKQNSLLFKIQKIIKAEKNSLKEIIEKKFKSFGISHILSQKKSHALLSIVRKEISFQIKKFHPKFKVENIRLKSVIKEHNGRISSICLLNDGRVASCSDDRKIKIHNISVTPPKCEITIVSHNDCVSYISQINPSNYLISSSFDSTIKIWEISQKKYKLIKTLTGHDQSVSKVIQISKNRICSSSWDTTIKVWNSLPNYFCISTLVGHNNWVISVIESKDHKYIMSGDSGGTLIFWSSSTYNLQKAFNNISACAWSGSLLEAERLILLVGGWSDITFINISTLQVETKVSLENKITDVGVFFLVEPNDESDTVIFGCDKDIIHLNLNTLESLGVKSDAHEKIIYSLIELDEKSFVTCSLDHTIKIWEY